MSRDITRKYFTALNNDEVQPKVDWSAHLELLPVAAWACSQDGGELHLNLACRRLLGVFGAEDLRNSRWARHVHRDDRQKVLRDWERFLRGSTAHFRASFRWSRPDHGRSLNLSVRVQRLSAGWFKGWVRESEAEQVLSRLEEITK